MRILKEPQNHTGEFNSTVVKIITHMVHYEVKAGGIMRQVEAGGQVLQADIHIL